MLFNVMLNTIYIVYIHIHIHIQYTLYGQRLVETWPSHVLVLTPVLVPLCCYNIVAFHNVLEQGCVYLSIQPQKHFEACSWSLMLILFFFFIPECFVGPGDYLGAFLSLLWAHDHNGRRKTCPRSLKPVSVLMKNWTERLFGCNGHFFTYHINYFA